MIGLGYNHNLGTRFKRNRDIIPILSKTRSNERIAGRMAMEITIMVIITIEIKMVEIITTAKHFICLDYL